MNEDIKFDHFEDLDDLLLNIKGWYIDDELDYNRWFGIDDMYKLAIIIENLHQELKNKNNIIKELELDVELHRGSVLAKQNIKFCEENKQLKEIIQKAIEYIKENSSYQTDNYMLVGSEIDDLLEILEKKVINKYV